MPIHIKGDKGFNSLGSYVEKLLRVKGQAQMSTVMVNKESQKQVKRMTSGEFRVNPQTCFTKNYSGNRKPGNVENVFLLHCFLPETS